MDVFIHCFSEKSFGWFCGLNLLNSYWLFKKNGTGSTFLFTKITTDCYDLQIPDDVAHPINLQVQKQQEPHEETWKCKSNEWEDEHMKKFI